MAVLDSALYADGAWVATHGLGETTRLLRERGGLAWIALDRPTPEEVDAVARDFGLHKIALHELAEEDATRARQRPRVERFGETLFVVLRPARYVEAAEKVEFDELHVFTGPDFVVTVQHGRSLDLARVRQRLEAEPAVLRLGPLAVLHAVVREVVDGYSPVVAGLENDIDEIEDQIFDSAPGVSRRIYDLAREVMAFQRATEPLLDVLETLEEGAPGRQPDVELRHRLRHVGDHVTRVVERAGAFRALLDNALTVHATLVSQAQNDEMARLTIATYRQNEQVKRISAWAAILFAPTLVGTIYGMNFRHMPELRWELGYPMALAGMLAMSFVLYLVFRRKHWL